MSDDLQALQSETEAALSAAADLREWDAIRVGVLGRNGKLTERAGDDTIFHSPNVLRAERKV